MDAKLLTAQEKDGEKEKSPDTEAKREHGGGEWGPGEDKGRRKGPRTAQPGKLPGPLAEDSGKQSRCSQITGGGRASGN